MKRIFSFTILQSSLYLFVFTFALYTQAQKPKISFTFDDGQTNDIGPYKMEDWNQMLLNHLKKHQLKAVLFSMGNNKSGYKGKYVLRSWNDAGHKIANHTMTHPYYHSEKISLGDFKKELTENDEIIKKYSNYYKYFRFPYLKEGDTKEKVEGFRQFMKQNGYKNGHVSIDASDWYIDNRLVIKVKAEPNADLSAYKKFYIDHLFDRAKFYDSLAMQLTGRRINHVLLLHHNLAAALFLDDLIQYFKDNGWEVMDASSAFKDKIYSSKPHLIPAGESLIWSLAKESGRFEKMLRYPAEDGKYEKIKMDALGL